MSYEMICASVRGASHIRKNIPCEDFGMKYAGENCCIFVLGDGHGDTNCPRSSIGSEYICRITAECLREFENDIERSSMIDDLFFPRRAEEIIRQLIKSIIGKWSEKVSEYHAAHPLTDEEKAGLSKEYAEAYGRGKRIEHVYGTTLIAGLMTEKYLLLIQQGDGRCVVFDKNGEPSQPVPWDEKCMANITTSVCDSDAANRCRYKVIDLSKEPVIACFLGSDGVEDSFSSFDMMDSFYRQIIERVCKGGAAEAEKYLLGYLPEFSAKGSADDTTVCGIVDIDAASEKLEKLAADTEIVSAKAALAKASERLPQMMEKVNYLRSRCEDLKRKVTEAEIEEQKSRIDPEVTLVTNKLLQYDDLISKKKEELDELKRELESVKMERFRFSSMNKLRCNSIWDSRYSIWDSRYSMLIVDILERSRYIDNIEASQKIVAQRLNALKGDILRKLDDLNQKLEAAEKEYTDYYKKYEEVLLMKEDAEKRLEAAIRKSSDNSEVE